MTVPIVIMAKAPVPGLVKTRLIPALGAQGAADLAHRFLVHATRQAVAAAVGPVELCIAPDVGHGSVVALARTYGVGLHAQGEGDLGARMHRVFVRHGGPALLMGSDAPAIDAALLRQAAAALESHEAVFVPAYDGGYALVGLRAPCASLFEDMPWSSPGVMTHSRARLAAAGLRHIELAPVHDIDEAADLVHVPGD
jgi:rSAM/selenodomain-associated transferase 1